MIVAALILLVALALMASPWPVGPYLLAVAVAWRLVRRRDGLIARAAATVLLPTTVGLSLLALLVLIVNTFSHALSPDDLAELEVDLAWSLGTAKAGAGLLDVPSIIHPELGRIAGFAALMATLALASYWLPSWRPVSKFLALKSGARFVIIVLAAMASFTEECYHLRHHLEMLQSHLLELRAGSEPIEVRSRP